MKITLLDRVACFINKKAIQQHLFTIASAKYPEKPESLIKQYVHSVWRNTHESPYKTTQLPMTRQHALHDYLMENR